MWASICTAPIPPPLAKRTCLVPIVWPSTIALHHRSRGSSNACVAANVLLESFANRLVQAREPLAHVPLLQADEHLQATGKTQHDSEARDLINCAARDA